MKAPWFSSARSLVLVTLVGIDARSRQGNAL